MSIDDFLAARVRDLRATNGLTLDQLAELSGVSRSMISLIERRETSPTAAVLNKLADAFGISLPALFAGEMQDTEPEPISRAPRQATWTDPESGYLRRHLTPPGVESSIELVEVIFPAGKTVAFDNPVRIVGIEQQVWVIRGAMEITLNDRTWRLETGDCMAMSLGARITFHNPNPRPARYVLALTSRFNSQRRPG